ncbi:unnamed protein product [Victoria cruziana]
MKRFSFPILFLALLLLIFSVAFARELTENKNEKHVTNEVEQAPAFVGLNDPCRFCAYNCCGNGCCSSEEEHAAFEKARRVP